MKYRVFYTCADESTTGIGLSPIGIPLRSLSSSLGSGVIAPPDPPKFLQLMSKSSLGIDSLGRPAPPLFTRHKKAPEGAL